MFQAPPRAGNAPNYTPEASARPMAIL